MRLENICPLRNNQMPSPRMFLKLSLLFFFGEREEDEKIFFCFLTFHFVRYSRYHFLPTIHSTFRKLIQLFIYLISLWKKYLLLCHWEFFYCLKQTFVGKLTIGLIWFNKKSCFLKSCHRKRISNIIHSKCLFNYLMSCNTKLCIQPPPPPN